MARKRTPTAAQIKKEMTQDREVNMPGPGDYLSTGFRPLNLAASGRLSGGVPKGTCILLMGATDSGKTIEGHTLLAEACNNPNFQGYRVICNNPERGAMPSLMKLFGTKLESKIEWVYSETVEGFYYDLDNACKAGKPFVYLLDSMDALDSEEQDQIFEAKKKFHEGRTKAKPKGSYKVGKAKVNSEWLKRAIVRLPKTGSILIIIAQGRVNLDPYSADKLTRAGGVSLSFYSTMEFRFSVKSKIKREVREKDRIIGTLSRVRVKRTRATGKDRTVLMPIYNSVGIDDTGGCIDYLVEEGHWKAKGKDPEKRIIKAGEFEFTGNREALVRLIEDLDAEKELGRLVKKVWQDIENQCAVKRKSRYE
jgi:RecA/RadA recombinase